MVGDYRFGAERGWKLSVREAGIHIFAISGIIVRY